MIDVNTGHLFIDNEHIVTPQMSFATIDGWQLGAYQKIREMGNGWSWIDVKNLKIDKLYLNISFLFNGKKIHGFTFTFQDMPYDTNPSWDSWNEEAEKANLARFNHWLDEQFGKERALEWGKVEAVYDPKSAGSVITLRYV